MEIDPPRDGLLITKAAEMLLRMIAQVPRSGAMQSQRINEDADRLGTKAAVMAGLPEMRMPKLGAENRRGIWHTERDSSGNYIVFERVR